MIDLLPLTIGLRSAVTLLCLHGLISWWIVGLPVDPTARWRTMGWLILIAGTVIFWSPVSLMDLADRPMPSPWDDVMRIGGLLSYVLASFCGAISWTLYQGGSMRRAVAVCGIYLAMTCLCVVAAYLSAGVK